MVRIAPAKRPEQRAFCRGQSNNRLLAGGTRCRQALKNRSSASIYDV